jgi:hypothetical protein
MPQLMGPLARISAFICSRPLSLPCSETTRRWYSATGVQPRESGQQVKHCCLAWQACARQMRAACRVGGCAERAARGSAGAAGSGPAQRAGGQRPPPGCLWRAAQLRGVGWQHASAAGSASRLVVGDVVVAGLAGDALLGGVDVHEEVVACSGAARVLAGGRRLSGGAGSQAEGAGRPRWVALRAAWAAGGRSGQAHLRCSCQRRRSRSRSEATGRQTARRRRA